MKKHVTILGWIYIGHSALLMLCAAFVFVLVTGVGLVGGIAEGDPEAAVIAPIVGGVVTLVLTAFAIPSFIAGMGLLDGRPWARILTLILGFFKLLDIPIGTAIGIYTFWVLMKPETDSVFDDREVPREPRSVFGT